MVVFFWLTILCFEALTVQRPEYIGTVLLTAERPREILFAAGILISLFAVLIIIKIPSQMMSLAKTSSANLLILSFISLLFLQNLTQLNVSSTAYVIIFFCSITMTMYADRRLPSQFYFCLAVALLLLLIAAVALHGLPTGRWIGGLHPNLAGAFALAAAYFAARSAKKARWIVYATATFFCILVSSRYAVVGVAIIALFDGVANDFKLPQPRLFVVTLCGLIFLVSFPPALDYLSNEILRLNDPFRGIGSGASGRMDLYSGFFPQLGKAPLFGFGFRNRDAYDSVHNGVGNLILEIGLIPSTIFALYIVAAFRRSIVLFYITKKPRYLTLTGCWCSWFVAGFFQPQLINFGDAFGFMTMFLMTDSASSSPRFQEALARQKLSNAAII